MTGCTWDVTALPEDVERRSKPLRVFPSKSMECSFSASTCEEQTGWGYFPERYDQSTMGGRFRKTFELTDPRLLLPGLFFGMSLEQAEAVLRRRRREAEDEEKEVTDEVWKARRIVRAQLHPETGENIPAPFRMSGFVAASVPITVGMLGPAPGIFCTVFWQWANQSVNAGVNICNAAETTVTQQELLAGYVAATGGCVGICLGLQAVLARYALPAPVTVYPSVALGNILNTLVMRRKELEVGIRVRTPGGGDLGLSRRAAKQAVYDTALTRVILPVPHLVFAPVCFAWASRTKFLKRHPSLGIPVQAGLIAAFFQVGLPFSMCLFDETGRIWVEKLEPEVAAEARRRGATEFVHYNKGL